VVVIRAADGEGKFDAPLQLRRWNGVERGGVLERG
jgi:hypothetical protein